MRVRDLTVVAPVALLTILALWLAFAYCQSIFFRDVMLEAKTVLLVLFISISLIANRNVLIRALIISWLCWLIIGILNTGAASKLYTGNIVNVEKATFIYLLYLAAFSAGAATFKPIKMRQRPNERPQESVYSWHYLLIAFPFAMTLEMYATHGSFPLLSGKDFVDSMYSIEYGFLYNYKLVSLFSIFSLLCLIDKSKSVKLKFFYLTLISITIFLSLLDGKRVVFLASLIIIASYIARKPNQNLFTMKLAIPISAVLIFYVLVALIRSGEEFLGRGSGIDHIFYMIGVEFKDYTWSVTHFNPGEIPGYSWTLSSIASLTNSSILGLLGIDKSALIIMDSARSWMNLLGIELGIRTGLFSELWFEFGYAGVLVTALFGYIASMICFEIGKPSSSIRLGFALYLYAFLMLAIMGQSTVLFGAVLTGLYILIAHAIFSRLTIPFRGHA